MSYIVSIRNNATQEVRTYEPGVEWADHSFYMWIDGNNGCDCNLYNFFHDDSVPDDDQGCTEHRFTPLFATLSDGTIKDIAAEARENWGYADDARWQS